jgi:hypothetical protein
MGEIPMRLYKQDSRAGCEMPLYWPRYLVAGAKASATVRPEGRSHEGSRG